MRRTAFLGAALIAAGLLLPAAQAQTPAPTGKQAADAAQCRAQVRQVYNRPEPRTVTLTDTYGRRAEGLFNQIADGRYVGLHLGREEREQYRYCMFSRGADPDQ